MKMKGIPVLVIHTQPSLLCNRRMRGRCLVGAKESNGQMRELYFLN